MAYPAVHGGDSVARLAHSDTLVLGYQLPLPQLFVYVTRALAPDPFWTRLVFATLGALAPVAMSHVVSRTTSTLAGTAAGVLLALHPLFVYYSIVPYQESLTVFLLLMAGAGWLSGRQGLASAALGLACLSRYEAWIAAGLAILHDRRPRSLLLYGWAPALWILAWRGLSPPGTYVLDVDPTAARLSRAVFLFGKLREYTGDVVLLLALAGAVVAVQRRLRPWGTAALFVLLSLAAVIALGHEFPPGTGRVSERLIHLPAAAVCAFAGLALGALDRSSVRVAAAAVLLAVGWHWTVRSRSLVAEANRDPSLRLAVGVARIADRHLGPGAHLGVVGLPVPADAVEDYVRKVEAAGGDVAQARGLARSLAGGSPDADRVAAHLPRPAGTVITGGPVAPALIAVFDDRDSPWPLGLPLGRLLADGRNARVYLASP